MNYRLIAKIVNTLLLIIGVAMLFPSIASIAFHEHDTTLAFVCSGGFTILFSFCVLLLVKPKSNNLKPREGFLTVALCWIVCALFGALPFMISGYTASPIDAFFESCASITTTGCTVMNLELMPRGLLMWKAVMHWLGGMGILVLAISIMPALGISGQNLYRAETSGIQFGKLEGKMSDSAKVLYLMYISFTLVEFILLSFSKMSIYEAIITTLGSVSTSGLFVHEGGLASYNSVYIEVVIAFFTIAVSVNFSLYHHLLKKDYRSFFDPELKAFLGILAAAVLLVTLNLWNNDQYDGLFETIRYSFFQVTAVATTTGYGITDYTLWPPFSRFILFILFFIGGCASSTSGSLKVIRVMIAGKLITRNIYQRLHPNAVVAVKIGEKPIPASVVSKATSFIFVFLFIFMAGSLVLSLQGLDIKTTLSASISMLSNTGIAFGQIGSSGNFSIFGGPERLVLCVLMLMGRLELFTIILLFTPSFWHPSKTKNAV